MEPQRETLPPLPDAQLDLIRAVLRRHPEVAWASIFGSRAKGTHTERSDVDLALGGDVDSMKAESIAAELEELPMPCRFDVRAMRGIEHPGLIERIERVGLRVYP